MRSGRPEGDGQWRPTEHLGAHAGLTAKTVRPPRCVGA